MKGVIVRDIHEPAREPNHQYHHIMVNIEDFNEAKNLSTKCFYLTKENIILSNQNNSLRIETAALKNQLDAALLDKGINGYLAGKYKHELSLMKFLKKEWFPDSLRGQHEHRQRSIKTRERGIASTEHCVKQSLARYDQAERSATENSA